MTVINPGGGGATLTQGTLAARPAATTAGAIYYATDVNQLYVTNSAGNAWQIAGAGFTQGTFAARPAASAVQPGALYFATDTGEWWINNAAGNGWQSIGQTSAATLKVNTGGNQTTIGANGLNTAVGASLTAVSGSGWQSNTNYDVSGVGGGIRVAEGSNAKQGTAVLVAGAVTVANTSVTANSRIFLTSNTDGGTIGFPRNSGRTAGTSFTITSSNAADTSTIAYQIFEPG